MWLSSRAVLGPLAALLLACGDPALVDVDAGTAVGPRAELTAELEVESNRALALVFGESAPLGFRYVEADGTPIQGATIQLALLGAANDASLDPVRGTTSADGRIEATVRAGTAASAFRVRASAERAAPVSVDVSVGEGGFGGIRARFRGPENRQQERVEARLFTNRFCDDPALLDGPGARIRVLDVPEIETTFDTLPVDVSYAVVGQALRSMGTSGADVEVGWGCTDSVELQPNGVSFAPVLIEPEPLDAEGDFDLSIELEARVLTTSIEDSLRASGPTEMTPGSSATFLLDAFETALRERGDIGIADALADARDAGTADSDLAAALASGETGPAAFFRKLEDTITSRVSSIGIDVMLSVGVPSGATRRGTFVGGTPGSGDRVDLAPTGTIQGTAVVRIEPMSDQLQIEDLSFPMPLGSLATATLEALASDAGQPSLGGAIRTELGCPELVTLFSGLPAVASQCDGACVTRTCDEVSVNLAQDMTDALTPLDERRNKLNLTGTADLQDSEGLLRVDALAAGSVSGTWSGTEDMGSDPVVGVFDGARSLQ